MADDKPVTASHSQVQPGLGADTAIRINLKHVLMALAAILTMGWGLAKYFYEQTHKDIDEVKDEVKELEKKIEDMDKRVDGHDVKISALEAEEGIKQRFADATGLDPDEVIGSGDGQTGSGTFGRRSKGGRRYDPFGESPLAGVSWAELAEICLNDPDMRVMFPRQCERAIRKRERGHQRERKRHEREDYSEEPMYEARGVGVARVLPEWDGDIESNTRRTRRQERREERRYQRSVRRRKRECRRDHTTCRTFKAGSTLQVASSYLAYRQNAEADMRQKP